MTMMTMMTVKMKMTTLLKVMDTLTLTVTSRVLSTPTAVALRCSPEVAIQVS